VRQGSGLIIVQRPAEMFFRSGRLAETLRYSYETAMSRVPILRFWLALPTMVFLAGCVSSQPLRVERSGTLPDDRYVQFD
jgi:hypothetical protein